MITISAVVTSRDRFEELNAVLPERGAADYVRLEDLPRCKPRAIVIINIDLNQSVEVQSVKTWLSNRSRDAAMIVCIDDAGSHLQLTQAHALGATVVVQRPLHITHLSRLLRNFDQPPVAASPSAFDGPSEDLNAIEDLYAGAQKGQSPSIELTNHAGTRIVDKLQDIGLSHYLYAIRSHHSRTYTHCLTVTAIAVAFGNQLGFGRDDKTRLAVAGLLHDIGKSQIDLAILEKPTPLDQDERAIMRTHPSLGYDMLRGTPGLPDDTLDMVLHHHEYLDGSGYPHGLQGPQISDLNRLMTIADVYGALIEPRSYKPPMSATQALDVLQGMGPKLDRALVRVFAPLAHNLAA